MKKNNRKKYALILIATFVLLTLSTRQVLAYIFSKAAPVTNTFVNAKMSEKAIYDAVDSRVSNFKVKNTGEIDTYVRVAINVTFEPGYWAEAAVSEVPQKGVNYSLDLNKTDWIEKDGHYYYKKKLKANETTEVLFTKLSVLVTPENYNLGLQFLTDHIQAVPAQAVEDAWGLYVTDAGLSATKPEGRQ